MYDLSLSSDQFICVAVYRFQKMEALITEHGGKVVGLEDPKLTHVVLDKRDESRRLELIRRTSKYAAFSVPSLMTYSWSFTAH